MKTLKNILIVLFAVIFFNNCHSNRSMTTNDLFDKQAGDYVSIEGLWISTPENSFKSSSGMQSIVIYIKRDNSGELTARGGFLWNGDYQKEWRLVDCKYDKLSRGITIIDGDGNTLKGIVDNKNSMITGAVHLKDNAKNSLNFVRANKDLNVTLLFHPRIPNSDGNIAYSYQKPEQLNDGIQTASISDAGVESAPIISLMKEIISQKYGRIESLLILKNNKLIIEEYFYGYNRTRLHGIASCTKSITSLLLGIALERHKEIKVDKPIFDFFPEYDDLKTEEKKQITLRHALTMTAGFQLGNGKEMVETDDWLRYILSRPMGAKPGEKFLYNDGLSILLGGIIHFLEGKHAQYYAEEFLFGPLGISEYTWETHQNGMPQCGGGLSLLPRDMAKIGLLVLNDGKWQNKQVVPEEWIRESTKLRMPESKYFDYGYQWWHRSKKNTPWWKKSNDRVTDENDMIVALGAGGQYIMVIRDLNMVVVTTASDYDNGKRARSKIPMVIEEVVPVFTDDKL